MVSIQGVLVPGLILPVVSIRTQECYPSRGYMSSVYHALIFGLGKTTTIDKLIITWPDLRVQTLYNIGVDQTITLDNEQAIPEKPEMKTDYPAIFKSLDKNKSLHYRHTKNIYINFNKQTLLPHFLSTQGPYMTTGDVNNDVCDDVFIGGARGFSGELFLQLEDGTFKSRRMDGFEAGRESEDLGVLFVDIDNDGDLDLFIGGRLTPGLYPIAPRSYILENDGKGYFQDVTAAINAGLLNPGMVTDALWKDFSGDGPADLILVGEWMPVSRGWWNSICSGDFDQDGDTDYLLGNVGLNFQIKPTLREPAGIYAGDFDNNGSLDAVMSYYINGRNYPMYSKFDLEAQIPEISKKYPSHESYPDQTISDIFPENVLNNSLILKAITFSSCYLSNLGNNRFELSDLPLPAQLSPVNSMRTDDYNNDGHLDVLLAGNFYGSRIPFGRLDGNRGILLLGDGKGNFNELPNHKSCLFINGEVRDIARVRLSSGKDLLLFTLNSDSLRLYQLTDN
jgi:hypothetical protein